MLTALGASPGEDRVYGQLVTAVSATESEIAEATGLSADEVRTSLASLIDRGLASRTPDSPTRFVAASPGVVEALISERLAELRSAQATLDRLATQYRTNSLARVASGAFEIVRGRDALRHCSLNLLSSARAEVLNLVKPPIIAVQSEERVQPPESTRGRLIFETQALENPGNLEAIQKDLRSQDEVRVHTKLPIKMLAVDRSVALLPLAQHDTTPVGVLVRESAVLDAFLALFEYVWATAVPLHVDSANSRGPKGPSVLSDDDRRLLSMLLAGLTDEAIAVHRGTSARTVQRKVQALMTVANVRTRMQLAWEAARQGWM
jgi:DNA-binding CsgD family transcriptional regulator